MSSVLMEVRCASVFKSESSVPCRNCSCLLWLIAATMDIKNVPLGFSIYYNKNSSFRTVFPVLTPLRHGGAPLWFFFNPASAILPELLVLCIFKFLPLDKSSYFTHHLFHVPLNTFAFS